MKTNKKVRIAIIMGSDSDLLIMKDAADFLREVGVGFEVLILSAHRTPEATAGYAKSASKRGIKVIIAAAGGAAHLGGVIASFFPLPVIGVPIKTSTLLGVDSLYSFVQMPPGVPVATVGINGAKNAAILAAQILATGDKQIESQIRAYKRKIEKSVLAKSQTLQKIGVDSYLKNKKNDQIKDNSDRN